ncbi:MAG: hypothetical protein JSW63_03140 [Ignavibacterium sp.]|nr:MAG: hypothetical protein JSW63_03140 [Ignavibacterium sp.]
METYIEPKELVVNPHYEDQKKRTLIHLRYSTLDRPIVDLIQSFNKLPYCFTLQSCYGHFVYAGQSDEHNLEPLPITGSIDKVKYRIAYICFCIENSALGREFLKGLNNITAIDPENIQLCCAEWFWKRQVNTYALQVEPDRFKHQDTAMLDYKEAVYIEKIRNKFFVQLGELLKKLQGKNIDV